MNYFELFDIPVQLKVDKKDLPKKYFELSRIYHPDFYTNASAEAQAEALERSALLNKALKTFQSEDDTIKYVLQLKNLLEEEEKFELPPDFLMEVLEINEQLMDASDVPDLKQKLEMEVDQLEETIYKLVKPVIEEYKDGITTSEELLKVKEYYYKKKYLHRIREQLNGKL